MARDNIMCDCEVIHENMVESARLTMPSDDNIISVAKLFKVLGDNTRCRIVFSLVASELCVCDISSLLNMTKSAISHQLATLKIAEVVKSRREGKTVYYSLSSEHVREIIRDTLANVMCSGKECSCNHQLKD